MDSLGDIKKGYPLLSESYSSTRGTSHNRLAGLDIYNAFHIDTRKMTFLCNIVPQAGFPFSAIGMSIEDPIYTTFNLRGLQPSLDPHKYLNPILESLRTLHNNYFLRDLWP